jgi:hypothetical protein
MKIYYTGIGSKKPYYYDQIQYIMLMRGIFHPDGVYNEDQLTFQHFNLPKDFDNFSLSIWINYGGAKIIPQSWSIDWHSEQIQDLR